MTLPNDKFYPGNLFWKFHGQWLLSSRGIGMAMKRGLPKRGSEEWISLLNFPERFAVPLESQPTGGTSN